jgi:predicted dehydrogenase
MLRGALIGLGNIAVRGHIPAMSSDPDLQSSVEIVAVLDAVESGREKMREWLPAARFYSDTSSLLANEKIDFVDVCTPPSTHAAYLRTFIGKGIHAICEKPLTESFETSQSLVEAIRSSNVVFVPCHQYKYSPLWKAVHDVIKSGDIGDVTFAQFNVIRLQADSGTAGWNPSWRTDKKHSGGGILVDTGAHYFYLTQYFFGLPKQVSAVLRTLKHKDYGVEDTAVVTLEYERTIAQINLTWAASSRANSVVVFGTKGSLSYDGVRLVQTDSGGTREIPMPDISDKSQYIAWYASLFKEFVCRIEEKNYSDDLLREAGNVMKLLDLSYRASAEERSLAL